MHVDDVKYINFIHCHCPLLINLSKNWWNVNEINLSMNTILQMLSNIDNLHAVNKWSQV